jgi:hypothetical protein
VTARAGGVDCFRNSLDLFRRNALKLSNGGKITVNVDERESSFQAMGYVFPEADKIPARVQKV